ncbi:hypothetical protein [Bythopirellula polymerisocia]|uniref:HTH HARE-type domain-containing protein n=1 Tax=Bythopirellula polymerisocia TaxID=2528003 RepID=A0A5C6CUW3_9BACT|nr:hypothetical protein [Bythopirellula polymerisocia]TWU27595.1 hypothetical protein Pla144_23720 [Bythopirellula polymerisocia]
MDVTAKVLAELQLPQITSELNEAMSARGYWKSPGGQILDCKYSSAITQEMLHRGMLSRFKKVEKGKFSLDKLPLSPPRPLHTRAPSKGVYLC